MFIEELTQQECDAVLARATFGRLACSRDDQPYIVPVYIAFDAGYLYGLSTLGQKIEWMRSNPKICVQLDEFASRTKWTSVIVNGLYEELPLPQFTEERAHARELLQHAHRDWWLPSMAERQLKVGEVFIEPIYFRVRITALSGLRATD